MTLRTAVPACSSSPIPAAAHRRDAPAALAPEQCRDLLDYLAQIPDPRHRRGRRHTLGAVLAVAVAAVVAGASSLVAIGEWASDAPCQVLAALGVRRDPLTGVWRPPGEATVRRVLARIDADALDRAIGAWLAARPLPRPANPPPPARSPRLAVAIDGKTLRGSGHHGHGPVHLLAVMDPPPARSWGRPMSTPHQRDRPVPAAAGPSGPYRHCGHRRRAPHPTRA